MRKATLGIYGIGLYLPPQIRKNDYWSPEIVASWQKPNDGRVDKRRISESESEGAKAVKKAMAENASDPFRGAVERRVLDDGMQSSDAEREAAEDALRVSSVDRSQIDFILGQTAIPDFLHQENAILLHHQLGLRRSAFALSTEGMCNAFSQQMQLAEGLIASGHSKFGLLVQSSAVTRIQHREDYFSPWFGDLATCVLVGPARRGGLVGSATITDGEIFGSMVTGTPGRHWYEGIPQSYVHDVEHARRMFMEMPDHCADVVQRSVQAAGATKDDVSFWACHQATPWLPRVLREFSGLKNARTLTTFPWTGSVLGANIPLVLRMAVKERMVNDGDLVATFAGASGITATSLTIQWEAW